MSWRVRGCLTSPAAPAFLLVSGVRRSEVSALVSTVRGSCICRSLTGSHFSYLVTSLMWSRFLRPEITRAPKFTTLQASAALLFTANVYRQTVPYQREHETLYELGKNAFGTQRLTRASPIRIPTHLLHTDLTCSS